MANKSHSHAMASSATAPHKMDSSPVSIEAFEECNIVTQIGKEDECHKPLTQLALGWLTTNVGKLADFASHQLPRQNYVSSCT